MTTEAATDGTEVTGLASGGEEVVEKPEDKIFPEGEGKTDEPKDEEVKDEDVKEGEAEDEEGKDEGPPESYEFTIPEDAFVGDGVQEAMKELGLTQEAAQKLVDAHFKDMEAAEEADANAWEEMKNTWWAEAKADTDIGGSSFDENVALARKGMNEFASEQAREVLQATGADHHPEILKMFLAIGKAISEDRVLTGSSQTPRPKSAAEHLFPSMNKE